MRGVKKNKRPPLASLTCVNHECQAYGERDKGNLSVRKVYGKDEIRYLKCRVCGSEFSERKGTALWNTKVREHKAVAIAEQLSEGTSYKGTARLTRSSLETVRRLAKKLGKHSQGFHDENVVDLPSTALQADERWGYVESKGQQVWEAEVIDPSTRLVVERTQGKRDEALLERLLRSACKRVSYPQGVVLFSDGEHGYAKLFASLFGQPYKPVRNGSRGRHPKERYRITRRQAHVQVVKQREGGRVVSVDIRLAHGSHKRVQRELTRLGYSVPNTSAIERRNGTARRMDAFNVRKSLSFARTPESREANGSWALTVYNWARENRSLKRLLPVPIGKRKYEKRSPAMAAGLTNFIWSITDILRYQLAPKMGSG